MDRDNLVTVAHEQPARSGCLNGQYVNVFSGEISLGGIATWSVGLLQLGKWITGIDQDPCNRCAGLTWSGLIDTHTRRRLFVGLHES
jgi:hypothetical protein